MPNVIFFKFKFNKFKKNFFNNFLYIHTLSVHHFSRFFKNNFNCKFSFNFNYTRHLFYFNNVKNMSLRPKVGNEFQKNVQYISINNFLAVHAVCALRTSISVNQIHFL